MNTSCPDCHESIPLPEDVRVGHVEICHHCGAEIEITAIGPVEVQTIEEEK